MYDRLLVSTDGSGSANAALELAGRIASPSATIHVLVVSEDDGDDGPRDVSDRTVDEILDDARETVTADVKAVVTEHRRGDPREQILEYIEAADVEIVVMGAHGRRVAEPIVLGRVTEGLVRDAPVPVLVARASDDIRGLYPFERILVPTDGSEHARAALELGVALAAETGATLHLLSVVGTTRYGLGSESMALLNQLEENATRELEAAAESAADGTGIDVRTTVNRGSIHRTISAYAEANDVDLLIMGTHGRSEGDRELPGSVTERVLRTAPAPVVTVRARETNKS
ncbi:UspA domain-containing protein [Haloterrigena salina JCM 13891]|uniref:UspA domain-containing protein n=1 Tax=Haloterrigena salina JCM 13891 TaxID=1227488 RepID=M0CQ49_9EURY|nr:universal stress protein [Haloterrigena salina]ELZ24502.1 UspA domain-containing protein [Haloterrigena salina JCM 13891]